MEQVVKYIQQGAGKEASAYKPALCFRGRSVAYAVINDETAVRAVNISLHDYDRAAPVSYHGQPYPVERILDHLLLKVHGGKPCTRRAAALLEAGTGAIPEEDLPPDDLPATDAPAKPKRTPREAPNPPAAPPIRSQERRTAKPAPRQAGKAPKGTKMTPPDKAKLKFGGGRGNLVRELATELKIDPVELRVKLRAAGMRAPYTDIKAMRKAIK